MIGGHTQGTVQGYDVDISNVELQFRYHPWMTSFFMGLATGNHVVKVSKSQVFMGQTVNGEAKINAGYVTPQFGWIKTWDSGFTLGLELGWLVPTSNSTDFTSNAPASVQSTSDYQQFESDVKDQGDQLGKSGVPYVTVVRLGWVF